MWTPIFACPACRGLLESRAETFACTSCGAAYRSTEGIVRCVSPSRLAGSRKFVAQFRRVRRADGHATDTAEAIRHLPYVTEDHPRAAEWRIRRESLIRLQTRVIRPGTRRWRVLDVGAGNGWLSNRLAAAGDVPVAVDLDDACDGLGAGGDRAPFTRVQAHFDELPFAPAQFDVVVLNASLHYSPHPETTLGEACRMLANGGALVVMDSPMFVREEDGEAMVRRQMEALRECVAPDEPVRPGLGYLTFSLLEQAAARLNRGARFFASRGPLGWRVRRAWSRYRLGRAPAAFGVWVAQ